MAWKFSYLYFRTDITGPKISSWQIFMSSYNDQISSEYTLFRPVKKGTRGISKNNKTKLTN